MSRPPVPAVAFVMFTSVAAVLVGVASVIVVSVELKAVVAVLVELGSVTALVVTPFVAAVSAASAPVMPTVVSPVAVGVGDSVVFEPVLHPP